MPEGGATAKKYAGHIAVTSGLGTRLASRITLKIHALSKIKYRIRLNGRMAAALSNVRSAQKMRALSTAEGLLICLKGTAIRTVRGIQGLVK